MERSTNSHRLDLPADDHQLVRQALGGCAESFELLVRRYQVPLMAYLRLRTRTVHDAEDAAQDAFLRAFEKLNLYRPRYSFKAWLFTIARRLVINANRRRGPADADLVALDVVDPTPGPVQQYEQRESKERLWAAAAGLLSECQFTALWLYYGEGMSTQQIGQVLGHSRPRVKTTLFRARKLLEQHPGVERPQRHLVRQRDAATSQIFSPFAREFDHA